MRVRRTRVLAKLRHGKTRSNALKRSKTCAAGSGATSTRGSTRATQKRLRAFNRQLFAECPELAIIKDIAEAAKHGGQLGRDNVQVKKIRGAGAGGIVTGFTPFGIHEHKPVCTLQAVLKDGSEKPLPELLTKAMQYWRDTLL
jgi:hypothetical protein